MCYRQDKFWRLTAGSFNTNVPHRNNETRLDHRETGAALRQRGREVARFDFTRIRFHRYAASGGHPHGVTWRPRQRNRPRKLVILGKPGQRFEKNRVTMLSLPKISSAYIELSPRETDRGATPSREATCVLNRKSASAIEQFVAANNSVSVRRVCPGLTRP